MYFLLRKKVHCKSKICARVKIDFLDLIFMLSFLFQSLMKIYKCPKRFSNFFENHRALPRRWPKWWTAIFTPLNWPKSWTIIESNVPLPSDLKLSTTTVWKLRERVHLETAQKFKKLSPGESITYFKGRFLGPSWTDSNCPGYICTGNICLGDICPY